jgi:hypothetical protein
MFYNDELYCLVDYTFYKIDYKIFKQIFMESIYEIDDYIILKNNIIIRDLDDDDVDIYNKYSLLTKNIRIKTRMYFIPFIYSEDKKISLKRMNESLMLNTITGNPI